MLRAIEGEGEPDAGNELAGEKPCDFSVWGDS